MCYRVKESEARWPLCEPGPVWWAVQASRPRLPPALGPASSPFKPQIFAFLTTAERGTESWKLQIDSGKGRKAKWASEGSSHQSHWPCLAWAPALPTVLTSWPTFSSGGFPDKRRCFLLGSSRALQRALRCDSCRLLLNPTQTIIRINCVTPSLLWGTIMKRNSGPLLIPSTKLIKVVWDKFLL